MAAQGHSEQEVSLSDACGWNQAYPDLFPWRHGLCHPDGYQAMSLGSLSDVHLFTV